MPEQRGFRLHIGATQRPAVAAGLAVTRSRRAERRADGRLAPGTYAAVTRYVTDLLTHFRLAEGGGMIGEPTRVEVGEG